MRKQREDAKQLENREETQNSENIQGRGFIFSEKLTSCTKIVGNRGETINSKKTDWVTKNSEKIEEIHKIVRLLKVYTKYQENR